MALQTLPRKFKLGRLFLDDPDPTASLHDVRGLHAKDFPVVRQTTVFDNDGVPDEVDGMPVLLFEYIVPPVKVNG